MQEHPKPLDKEAHELFARKGREGGADVPQVGDANGVKVRRVMQVTRDLVRRPFEDLRILDLGCGEGVYAIEACLRGAHVVAIDARTERMDQGAACAARHGIRNVLFRQDDVRSATVQAYGRFDVVYLLGMLYHLDAPDIFRVLANIRELCTDLLVLDTLVALDATDHAMLCGRTYSGRRVREHDDEDSPETRRRRVLKSIDNAFSFRFTKDALIRALNDTGFTSVLECHVPREPGKAADRITLVARSGEVVRLSTYPWVNDKTEDEIEKRLRNE